MKSDSSSSQSRRDFLKTAGTWSVASLASVGLGPLASALPANLRPLPANGTARGTVYLDTNRTGKARGQLGLAGMLVCNGVDIAVTDAHGRYELPVTDDTIVYLIKPRGYMTATDGLNLPRFYYIHKPKGSPDQDFNYKGVAPTGKLPDSIDFPLYEHEETDTFEVLFTADPQSYNLQHLQWYGEETTREFKELDVVCGIALGDIVGDHLDLYEPYNQVNALTGFPWYNVIGNHDLNFMAKEDRYSAETFERVFGPTTYAFQRGPVHFIVLNNVLWNGFAGLRQDGWPRRRQYNGHIRPWQLEFVRNYLKHVPTEDRVVICGHIPMLNMSDEASNHTTPEFPQLLEILSTHPHTMSLSGHTHINMNFQVGAERGYRAPGGTLHHHFNLTATCGSWYRGPLDHRGIPFAPSRDGTPKGYAVIRFEGGDKYHVRFKALGMDADHQMTISVPSLVTQAALAETSVHVNVFNATDQTRAKMRIDNSEWTDLKQVVGTDLAYERIRERSRAHPEAGEGELPGSMVTNHHWVHALPSGLAVGWHNLEIAVTDAYGETQTDSRTFLVANDPADHEHLNQGTRQTRNTGA